MRVDVEVRGFQEVLALVGQWQKRARAVRRQFLHRVVQQVYDEVRDSIPAASGELRDALQVSRVKGLPDTESGYVVRAVPRGRKITEAESESTVIYVAARENLMRSVPDSTRVLEQFGPWTFDTIPYPPDPKTAEVISRRVSRREVVRVGKLRKRDRPVLERAMAKAGLRRRELERSEGARVVTAVPDVVLESLRLEFGLGGAPPKPHWRKAILRLASRGGAGMIAKKREFSRAMTDPAFTAWRQWPKRVTGTVTVAEARQYVPFQKRLGLRVLQG